MADCAQALTQEEQAQALDIARAMAAAGIPIFVAHPKNSDLGFRLPDSWQTTTPNPRYIDAWRPGMALCAVMGRGLDLVDLDPRNGGSAESLNGFMPTVYGVAATPSGGRHGFVRSMGVRSHDNVLPGIDIKAGDGDGLGRGFAFLAPTVRPSKVTGELVSYRWERAPDLDALAAAADDRTGEKLAALVRAAHGSTTADDPFAPADNFGKPSPWDDLDATIANNSRHDAVHKLASALRGRGGWRAGDALAYIREIVWPKLDQARGGHPYTSDELKSDVRDAFTRYNDGPSDEYRPTQPTVVDPEADPFDGAGEGLNDGMLCAEVAKNVMAGRYRWVRGMGWLTWTGIHWTPAPDQAVAEETRRYLLAQWRRAVQRLERAKTDEERKTGEQVVGSWRGTLGKSRITAITTLAQGIATILTGPADLDAHPDLLNVGNGVVDLRTGLLSDHDPGLLLSLHTPVAYRPDATHPDWDAALAAVPADVRGWLQLRYGQGITGHMTPDDLLVVQDGGGENGKTTYAVAVRGALGDYYVAISHRALLGDPSQHPTELMSFRGARVALLEELPEERRLSVVRLKALIGTPTMKARLIRQDEVEWAASHTLFLNTNHLPVVDETDHGTWRRLARLRFPYVFRKPGEPLTNPQDRRGDPNLRQRLQEGRHGQHEAVLAWLVAGAVAWYAADRIMPPLPPRVVADTREWRGKSDLLLAYAAERLIFDLTAHVLAVELLADFNTWLTAHGHHEWSDRTLAGRLEEHGEFIAHNVTKKHIRANENLFRRTPTISPPPGQYKAWLGVRFRQSHDGWPDDETAGQASSVSAVSGSSDNPREISIARVIPTTRNSGNNDPRDATDGTRPCGSCGRSFHPDPPSRAVCDTCRPHLAGSFGTEATA